MIRDMARRYSELGAVFCCPEKDVVSLPSPFCIPFLNGLLLRRILVDPRVTASEDATRTYKYKSFGIDHVDCL